MYYECVDFRETPEHAWCLPACVATIMHHWKSETGAAWRIPDEKDPQHWVQVWKPLIQTRYSGSQFGIDISTFRPSDIDQMLGGIGAKNEVECRLLYRVDDVLLEATGLLSAGIPPIVLVDTNRMFSLGSVGRLHSIILMGKDRSDNFRLFDPHRADFTTQWSTKHLKGLAPCIVSNFLCIIAPQSLYSFVDIDKRQMRLPGFASEEEGRH